MRTSIAPAWTTSPRVALFSLASAIACGQGREHEPRPSALAEAAALLSQDSTLAAHWSAARASAAHLSWVKAPRFASEPLELRDVSGSRLVSLRPLSCSSELPSEGTSEGAITHYPEACEDTDQLLVSAQSRAELLSVLHSARAHARQTWRMDLGSRIAAVLERDGGLVFLDARDELLLRIPEPYAIDARGVRRRAALQYKRDERELSVTLETSGLTWPVLLDPAFETEMWVHLVDPPNPSNDLGTGKRPILLFDPEHNNVVTFGGDLPNTDTWLFDRLGWHLKRSSRGGASPTGGDALGVWDSRRRQILGMSRACETYYWDGTDWNRVGRLPTPGSELVAHSLVFDEERGEAMVFGGWSLPTNKVVGDTFVLDGMRWRKVIAPVAPTPRQFHAMAYDPSRKVSVLFGGSDGNANFNDTWTFNGATWTKVDVPSPPPVRVIPQIAYHPGIQRIVMYGGTSGGNELGDTWTFDGARWIEVVGATPPARRDATFVWDPTRAQLVLSGGRIERTGAKLGDTWLFSGTSWTQLASPTNPSPRVFAGATYSPMHRGMLLFGGSGRGLASYPETWLLPSAGTWEQLTGGVRPRVTYGLSATVDSSASSLLAFGGYFSSPDPGANAAKTWQFRGLRWGEVTAPVSPTARANALQAFDANTGRTILFGGDAVAAPTPVQLNDTWAFDGSTWAPVASPNRPPARYDADLAYDPVRKAVLLHGGNATLASLAPLADTWVLEPGGWRELNDPGPTPALESTLVRNDSGTQWLRFGGKSQGGQVLAETWLLEPTGWRRLMTARSPAARSLHSLAWDTAHRRWVLFGGKASDGTALSDTWLFDGTDWRELTKTPTPPGRFSAVFLADAASTRLLLHGGSASRGRRLNDTWSLSDAGWVSLSNTQEEAPTNTRRGQLFQLDQRPIFLRAGLPIYSAEATERDVNQDEWLLYTRGGVCTNDAACTSGHCVDGVCCEVASCGSCQTCNGESPGRCTVVANAEDPDTCKGAEQKICDRLGRCGPGPGAQCGVAADCATGACIDGVCCDRPCDGACEACAANAKVTGKDDGYCGPARRGSNPGNRCGDGGVCGRAGACEVGTTCQSEATLVDPLGNVTSCGDYVCRAGACLTRCDSIADCVAPLECDASTRTCMSPRGASSGCGMGTPANVWLGGGLLLTFVVAVRRRRRDSCASENREPRS